MAAPMLCEAASCGAILVANPSLAETVLALETAELTNATTFAANDPSADFAPDISAAVATAPALNQSDEETAQELFHRLRDVTIRLSVSERATLRNHLVLLHTPLVEHCARSLAVAGESLEDLAQEGYVGLIKAVDRFNPDKGARFSTYAYHLISGEIRHYLRDLGKLIHEPGWHSELRQKVSRTSENLTQKLGRMPGLEEVAVALNLPVATVHEVLKRQQSLVVESLDTGGSENGSDDLIYNRQHDDGQAGLHQVTAPLEDWVDTQLLLQEAWPRLSELERCTVQLFFYAELSKTEIARRLGISVNYAAYLVKRGLKHLRQIIEESEREPIPRRRRTPRSMHRTALISSKKSVARVGPCSAANGRVGQPVTPPVPAPEVVPAACKSVVKIMTRSGMLDATTAKLADVSKRVAPLPTWHPATQQAVRQIAVPPSYRNNVAALPEFAHWLREAVRRVALSTPELCLVWYQVRGGCNTMTRLDTAQAEEAVGAAQALTRRYGRNVAMIKRPASSTASKFYFCVASPDTESIRNASIGYQAWRDKPGATSRPAPALFSGGDEDILIITSPANFTQHANLL